MTKNLYELGSAIRRYAVEEATMLTPTEQIQHLMEAVKHYIRKEHGPEFVPASAQPPIVKSWKERFVSMQGELIDDEDKARNV